MKIETCANMSMVESLEIVAIGTLKIGFLLRICGSSCYKMMSILEGKCPKSNSCMTTSLYD